jgi:hypothetical protein
MNTQYKKYVYLLEENDLDDKTTDEIEKCIRQGLIDIFCNKNEEYLTDEWKEYLNNKITYESNSVQNPIFKTYSYKQYLKTLFTNVQFTVENNEESIIDFLNEIFKKETIKLEIRIRVSQLLFGDDYKEKIFSQLSGNEISQCCKIFNIDEKELHKKIIEHMRLFVLQYTHIHDTNSLKEIIMKEMKRYTNELFANELLSNKSS